MSENLTVGKFILRVILATVTYGVFTYFFDYADKEEFSFLALVVKSLIFGAMMGIIFAIVNESPWRENKRRN